MRLTSRCAGLADGHVQQTLGHAAHLAPVCAPQGIVTVGAVDCDVEANKPLCGRYEVRGFPTLKVFPGDKSKGGNKSPTDYQGVLVMVGSEACGMCTGMAAPCFPSAGTTMHASSQSVLLPERRAGHPVIINLVCLCHRAAIGKGHR